MDPAPSDALVFFGATGDLAYKQIFPALQGLVRRRRPRCSDRRRRQVRLEPRTVSGARQRQSSTSRELQRRAISRACVKLLKYVDGDYNDPQTFERLKQALGPRQAPPALSRDPARAIRRRRVGARCEPAQRECAHRGRETVRPRSRVGAGARPDAGPVLPRRGDLPHRPLHGQGARAEHRLHPVRQCDDRAAMEPATCPQRPDHHGGSFRRSGPRQLLRRNRRAPRRGSEPPAAGRGQPDDGASVRRGVTRPYAIRRPR